MEEKDVVYISREGTVGSIVLNQPHKKNAISAIMMDKLTDALHELEQDDAIRVIVLRSPWWPWSRATPWAARSA